MNNHTRKTDDNKPITPDEWNNAINHLLTTIPLRFFRDVMILSKQEGSTWGLNRYHGLVMIIRNNLRKAGYNWGDIALDNYWQQLLEDAVTQVKSKIQYYEQHPEKAESHWKKPYQFPPEPPSYPMKYIIQIIITASREFEVYNYLKKHLYSHTRFHIPFF